MNSPQAPGDAYRKVVMAILMMGTFLALLTTSAVNVALPHMMGAFGVNRDQIQWVSTAFMMASAIVMPFVAWLTTRVDYKTIFVGSLALFVLGSAACAVSWNFETLITARVIQALGGGAIPPLGIAIVAEIFEPKERGSALGLMGTGIMLGPASGPTLGGYLADEWNWRAIFSLNIPLGLLTLVAAVMALRPLKSSRESQPFDFFGFAFLSIALSAALTALSNGQQKGWDSDYILICEAFAVVGCVMFIAVELAVESPLLDLRLFLIRNYSLGVGISALRSVGLFSGMFLFPLFLQKLMGYTSVQSGFWMLWTAGTMAFCMPVAGMLADRYAPSTLVSAGAILAGGSFLLFGYLDPMSGWAWLVLPQIARGMGFALLMAPIMAASFNFVPKAELPMASSFMNVAQNVGGALGIAAINNYVTNSIHEHAVTVGSLLTTKAQAYARLNPAAFDLVFRHSQGVAVSSRFKMKFAALFGVQRHAQVSGFENGFVVIAAVLLLCLPLALLLLPAQHHLTRSAGTKEENDAASREASALEAAAPAGED